MVDTIALCPGINVWAVIHRISALKGSHGHALPAPKRLLRLIALTSASVTAMYFTREIHSQAASTSGLDSLDLIMSFAFPTPIERSERRRRIPTNNRSSYSIRLGALII